MRSTVLTRHLTRVPIQPFRIVMTDGVNYEIRHPDQAIPYYAELEVSVRSSKTQLLEGDFTVSVSYLHIMRLEPILPPVSGTQVNGAH